MKIMHHHSLQSNPSYIAVDDGQQLSDVHTDTIVYSDCEGSSVHHATIKLQASDEYYLFIDKIASS